MIGRKQVDAHLASTRREQSEMHHAQLTESVRCLVTEAFAELGSPPATEVRETILIRDGGYCGRRFENDQAAAVWFVEEDQLKVYRADGTIHRVMRLGRGIPLRAAA
jgi:hypothetical protein